MMIRVIFICSLFFFISCTNSSISINKCNKYNKVSDEYVKCLENLINSTNTAQNFKEFRKHQSLESFLKRVTVTPSQ